MLHDARQSVNDPRLLGPADKVGTEQQKSPGSGLAGAVTVQVDETVQRPHELPYYEMQG